MRAALAQAASETTVERVEREYFDLFIGLGRGEAQAPAPGALLAGQHAGVALGAPQGLFDAEPAAQGLDEVGAG